jgi:hypothetical protein
VADVWEKGQKVKLGKQERTGMSMGGVVSRQQGSMGGLLGSKEKKAKSNECDSDASVFDYWFITW